MNTATILSSRVLTSVGRVPGISRALRWYVARYPENSVVEIKYGRAAGLKWRRHHRYVNGYWIGHYESAVQDALARDLKPGETFYDIGANAGFFTLIGARLVGGGGRCVAFEPSRQNCASIAEEVQLNAFANCTVVDEAISDMVGRTFFSVRPNGSSITYFTEEDSRAAQMPVKVTTLDGACTRFGPPDFIKMDVEGSETRVLRGAWQTLRSVRPSWLIEQHGPKLEEEVRLILFEADYTFFNLGGVQLDPDRPLPKHFIAKPLEKLGP